MPRAVRTVLTLVLVAAGLALLELLADHGLNAYFARILLLIGINMVLAVSLNLITGFTGQFSLGHAGFMGIGAYTSAWLTVTIQP